MIVVTGSAGFIGSCVLAQLNSVNENNIVIVDHLDDPLKERNLHGKKYARYFDKKDFLEAVVQDKIDFPVEAIIHMGACSSTTLQDADYFEHNNFLYSKKLAEWSLKHDARFIYASSAATYGDGSFGYSDSDENTKRLKPLNLYGMSKQKFDLWVLEQGLQNRFVGLKFFNVFGPNEYHKGDMKSIVAKSFKQVSDQGVMRLFKSYKDEYADGEQQRDFIYVKDAIDVVMFFFHNPQIGGIYNVGTGKARSWNDLAKALFKALDKEPSIEYFDMPEVLRQKYQYFTEADITKLRDVGYMKPFRDLEDAVCDYVGYLKQDAHL